MAPLPIAGRTILIVFGGLPGSGKTTLARPLAARLGAAYLRIDTIEQSMRTAGLLDIGAAGYTVANALAAANLANGLSVVADCVNPVGESRQAWQLIAQHANASFGEIELVCSDAAEHRRRVETRVADIPGLVVPDWDAVTNHRLEPWPGEHLVLDTAHRTPAALLEQCAAYVAMVSEVS